ncbi:hypothetical protein CSU29_003927 [Salmonella enterica subsp. diarizonae]|nr:hypothetical protein [Salmonella enterica subsp. enterica]EDV3183333.1 hypothetical protein [Salmonella enterica subsp. diarizonae]EEH4986638.1 hypothetical protein [Salmonella enterica]
MMPVRAWKATHQRQNKIPVPESPKPSRLREVLFCIFRKTALAPPARPFAQRIYFHPS